MKDKNDENLKALFEKFITSDEASAAAEDIARTDEIFDKNPAPEPDDMVLAEIKAELAMRLPARRKTILLRKIYSVAAIILIAIFAGIRFFSFDSTLPMRQAASITIGAIDWDNDDSELASLDAEIKELENEFAAIRLDEYDLQNGSDVEEMEIELITIETDFWKG